MACTRPQLRWGRAITYKCWTWKGMETFLLEKAVRKPLKDPRSVLVTLENADVLYCVGITTGLRLDSE